MTDKKVVSGGKVWVPELPAVQAKMNKRVQLAGYLFLVGPLGMIITLIVTLITSKSKVETTSNSITFVSYVTPLHTIIIMVVFGVISVLFAPRPREISYIIMICFLNVMMIIIAFNGGTMKALSEKHQVLEDFLTSQGYTIPEDFSFSKMPDETVTSLKKGDETVYIQWTINQDKTEYSFKEIDMPEK